MSRCGFKSRSPSACTWPNPMGSSCHDWRYGVLTHSCHNLQPAWSYTYNISLKYTGQKGTLIKCIIRFHEDLRPLSTEVPKNVVPSVQLCQFRTGRWTISLFFPQILSIPSIPVFPCVRFTEDFHIFKESTRFLGSVTGYLKTSNRVFYCFIGLHFTANKRLHFTNNTFNLGNSFDRRLHLDIFSSLPIILTYNGIVLVLDNFSVKTVRA